MVEGYVAFGSNLSNRLANLRGALQGLSARALPPDALSSVYETEPLDGAGPSWFLNMVARIRTDLAPLEVLGLLLEVENAAGRVRTVRNAPRVLDLDLLLLGDLCYRDSRLTLPHPRMWHRRFVLAPLAELAPDLRNPVSGRTVRDELNALQGSQRVIRLGRLESLDSTPV